MFIKKKTFISHVPIDYSTEGTETILKMLIMRGKTANQIDTSKWNVVQKKKVGINTKQLTAQP